MIWKDVKGYEGLYKVNEAGDVVSIERRGNWRGTHIMIPMNDKRGYRQLCLTKNGKAKTIKIHRLVAEAFIPNPNNFPEVNHIDEDKWNCHVSNLEWCDRLHNMRHGTRIQRMSTPVAMCSENGEIVNIYPSIQEACRKNNFRCAGNISNVLKGKAIRAYGYKWKEIS